MIVGFLFFLVDLSPFSLLVGLSRENQPYHSLALIHLVLL
jgi:hypothetical protein